jgi:hypothetical protein
MININLKNIEELVLKNPLAKSLFPDLRHLFDQWLLSYRFSALDTMRKQAMLDLLNSLDGPHVEKLARLFGDMISVEKLDYHIVRNLNFSINDSIGGELTKHGSYTNIALSRSANQMYITMWR